MEKVEPIFIEPIKVTQNSEYQKIQELTEDILGYRGEFLICESCNMVLGKNEIFGKSKGEFHRKTIKQLMEERGSNSFSCNSCGKKMRFMYGEEYIKRLKRRCSESIESYLSVAKNSENEWVGYTHCYVENFDTIFQEEFSDHFKRIGLEKVRDDIERVLGYPIKQVYNMSFIGLMEKYNSFTNTFEQLQKVQFPSYPIVGVTEVDKNRGLYGLYQTIGGISIIYDESLLQNAKKGCHWCFVIFQNPKETHNKYLANGVKGYLRKIRTERKG